ncbi:diguanylate cyclase [Croceicoccus sp. F390]|uniref:diguanylate cyclase n=1 Tax=Croceicoccus esteveae TaxID=3075597 RepID=A0ABU2ZJE4_9SPHN|nr:diguanylate cyclase [Croceicoccus sp. F390]MDT0576725.1 diguanylate cyclase [Croceicoccus sp. F390]
MNWRHLPTLLLICLGFACFWLTHAPAHAASVAPSCRSYTDAPAQAIPTPPSAADWQCGLGTPNADHTTSWLRFDRDDLAGAPNATHLVTQIGKFDRIWLIAEQASGGFLVRSYVMDDIELFANGPRFAIALPDLGTVTTLLVAIERPWNTGIGAQAVLQTSGTADHRDLGWSWTVMLANAAMCGLLLVPLFYNAAFYMVLRQKFILWHIVIMLGMLGYLLFSSGLVNLFVPLDLRTLAFVIPFIFLVPLVASAAFTLSYLEAGAISPAVRRLLFWTIAFTFTLVTIACLPVEPLRPYVKRIYYIGFFPMVVVYLIVFAQAVRRRSRAVWFQIAAWTPVMIMGMERIMRGVTGYTATIWLDQLFNITLMLEVMITAIGVVDRFNRLRQERDGMTKRVGLLSTLVDRDELTGIFNRRALDRRFDELRAAGYDALAVIDLDNFKKVNDENGHDLGDRVLQEVATVLSDSSDALAFRMGGEEFIVLFRGKDACERAEQMRAAIPAAMEKNVPGLTSLVTASMGLVESSGLHALSMRQLYAHADRLMYQAKNNGRDRLVCGTATTALPAGMLMDRRNSGLARGRRQEDQPIAS